jgi:hypothetical protein
MRALIIVAATLGFAAAAQAQTPAAQCPSGTQAWVVRTSKVKPGQEAAFEKALADQQAWYRSKGIATNAFKAGPVADPKTGVDPTLRMTVHINAPVKRPPNDAAWDAFVAEFRASSDIVTQTYACLADAPR